VNDPWLEPERRPAHVYRLDGSAERLPREAEQPVVGTHEQVPVPAANHNGASLRPNLRVDHPDVDAVAVAVRQGLQTEGLGLLRWSEHARRLP